MVVLQFLGASAIISSLTSCWCRFMPCSYAFSAISSSRDAEMSSGIEEMEAELNAGGMHTVGFSLWHCQNFAKIAKILQP